MLLSDIKSRPTYGKLQTEPLAKRHIIAAEGEGFKVVEALFAGQPALLSKLTLVYTAGASAGEKPAERLRALGPDALHLLPSVETVLVRLGGLLATATMGTRLSVTGGENFIGQAVAIGVQYGIDPAAIATEHRGSLARRVQCVHCKGFTADVTVSPVTCSHCGISLLVRDHYSRRLGAFMGVSIDAEAPGDIPEPEAFSA